jgi:hypothetical protein
MQIGIELKMHWCLDNISKSEHIIRLALKFNTGDLVLLNPHSLSLLRNESRRGKKLLMKYDGPFEVIQKLSPL